jgi:hypothetical protein
LPLGASGAGAPGGKFYEEESVKKKKMIGAMLVGVLMLACSEAAPAASPSPSVVTVTETASPSPATEPEVTLATIRGPFNGKCVTIKTIGPVEDAPNNQAHWKFRPQGDHKVILYSKSGGYTMKLDRTAPTKFYGTAIQGNDWQFAFAIKIVNLDPDGMAHAIEVTTHETSPGGFGKINALCRLPAGSGAVKSND